MSDELPSGTRAVYIYLEMIALGFALEGVAAFMRGEALWKWAGALVVGALFLVAGVKSPQVRLKVGGRFSAYLNSRPILTVVFFLFSLYLLQALKPDFIVQLHHRLQGWLGFAAVGLVGAVLSCGYWWLTGKILSSDSAHKPSDGPKQIAAPEPGNVGTRLGVQLLSNGENNSPVTGASFVLQNMDDVRDEHIYINFWAPSRITKVTVDSPERVHVISGGPKGIGPGHDTALELSVPELAPHETRLIRIEMVAVSKGDVSVGMSSDRCGGKCKNVFVIGPIIVGPVQSGNTPTSGDISH